MQDLPLFHSVGQLASVSGFTTLVDSHRKSDRIVSAEIQNKFWLERLLREEARLSANNNVQSAFVATNKFKGKNKVSSRDEKVKKKLDKDIVRCYRCKELGHFAKECRGKKRENNRGNDDARDCAFVVEGPSR